MSEAAAGVARLARRRAARSSPAWPFPADDERRLWFYTPTDHGGLPLSAMRPAQQRRRCSWSPRACRAAGYVTVSTIMGLENVLDEVEGWTASFGARAGPRPGAVLRACVRRSRPSAARGRGGSVVTTSRSTTPSSTARWSVVTPCFLGADPASSPLLGPHPLRPLAGAEDLGRELVRSLDDGQRARPRCCRPSRRSTSSAANRARLSEATSRFRSPTSGDDGSTVSRRRVEAIQRTAEQRSRAATRAPRGGPLHVGAPKGSPAATSTPTNGSCCAPSSTSTCSRIPDELADAEAAKYAGRRRPRRAVVRLGGWHRARSAPLLPGPGPAPAGRVRQHPARRQPRPRRLARDLESDFGGDALGQHYAEHHDQITSHDPRATAQLERGVGPERCGVSAGGAVDPRTTSLTGSRTRLASIWPRSIRAARRPLVAWFWRTVVSGGTEPAGDRGVVEPDDRELLRDRDADLVGDSHHPGGDVVGHREDGRRRRIASQQPAHHGRELVPFETTGRLDRRVAAGVVEGAEVPALPRSADEVRTFGVSGCRG